MRPAYGRKVVEFLRHNVFTATTNETNFLQGDNGNRRWWIVTVNDNGHVSMHPQHTTTMTVHKPQHFHSFSHYDVTIIIYLGEISLVSTSVQTTVIHNLNTVIILVEL